MPRQKRSKKSKRADGRPARVRYWMKRQLEKNKVKNLMRYCGMTRIAATIHWQKHRTTRIKDGFLIKI